MDTVEPVSGVLVAGAMGLLLAFLVGLQLRRRAAARAAASGDDPVDAWLADRRFVVHARRRGRWVTLRRGEDGSDLPWFAVTYEGTGELAALVGTGAHPPPHTPYLLTGDRPPPPLPEESELEAGARRVQVHFDRSPLKADRLLASLTNQSDTPIRVIWFGAWTGYGDLARFDTVTGHPFDSVQFRAWYAVPEAEGWVAPGETVEDPLHHGGGLWVWAFETPTGESFVVGGRPPPIRALRGR